jgi:lysozyme
MQLSTEGRQLLCELEGIEYEPYHDSAGLLTIGVGHCLTKDERSSGKIHCGEHIIRWKDGPLTEHDIDILLQEDVQWAEAVVNTCVTVPLTQQQFDSLVIFCFNIGNNAFTQSTLCKVLNEGQYEAVPAQLVRWNKANGRVLQGLVNRRNREIALWNTESYATQV